MNRTLRRAAPLVAAAIALAACGTAEPDWPVHTRELPGVGTVLVNKAGDTLYRNDSDEPGNLRCHSDCLDLWHPATVAESSWPDSPIAGLATVHRSDGTNQLTYQDRPLYTFDLDSDSEPASGHNVTDVFNDVEFLWNAAVVEDGRQPAPADAG